MSTKMLVIHMAADAVLPQQGTPVTIVVGSVQMAGTVFFPIEAPDPPAPMPSNVQVSGPLHLEPIPPAPAP